MDERQTVFICHANPEDNDFTSWLGSRLANAGYDVWADILSLVGGEMISPAIGDVIRERAAIVIVALSRASHRKEGVLNEVAIASTVERKLGLTGFVLPVVLDDLQMSEFPDELVRRLSIDFSRDWADGLSEVLTALDEAKTPRFEDRKDAATSTWRALKTRGSALRTDKPDLLLSNWFKLGQMPDRIHFSRFLPSSDIEGAFKQFQSPAHRHHRLAISFANAGALSSGVPNIGLEDAYEVDLDDFLAGHRVEGVPQIRRYDARNIVVALLNSAWGRFAQSRGLLRREFVSGDSWFVPLGLFEKDRGLFVDGAGETHWRQLAGHSEARGVRWHFAVSARATIAEPSYLTLRSHVVFTEDDETPVEGRRAHQLRRSFCKNWWNPRWRDLLLAFVARMASEADHVELRLSPNAAVSLSTTPMRFGTTAWVDDDDSLPASEEAVFEDYGYDGFDETGESEGHS